jgi:hypothetical protein
VSGLTVLQEVGVVVIVIWNIFDIEVLLKCLPHVKQLTVLTVVFLQWCTIDYAQILYLGNRPHPYVGIAETFADGVVFDVEGLELLHV